MSSHVPNDNIKIISADVFDTILLRNGHSEERRFYCSAKKIKELCNNSKVSVRQLFIARYLAHHWLYNAYTINQLPKEPSIYSILKTQLAIIAEPMVTLDAAIFAEKETEIIGLKLNKELYEYLKLLSNEKKLILFSDMYLSSAMIRDILKIKGFNLKFDLFVSSEVGVSKHRGTAFDWICTQYEVISNEILHIGDNYTSDYINALNAGCYAQHTPRSKLFYFIEDACKTFDKIWLRTDTYA